MAAKARVRIRTDDLPKRSPDFNVLDYSLWKTINRKMRLQERNFHALRKESAEQYLARLRRTAFGIPKADVERAIGSMHRRVRLCIREKGGLFKEGR